jgi:hypothetical protein
LHLARLLSRSGPGSLPAMLRPPSQRVLAVPGLLCALALGASACGPSIDPALKADVDRRVALLKPSGQSFPAPVTAAQPMPMAVGQWVQYRVTDEKKQPGFFTMKVVDELQGAYFIEYVNEGYTGKTVTKLHLYLGDRSNPEAMDVRGVKMKDAKGTVTELPPEMLAMMRGTYRNLLQMVTVSWQGLPQENIAVPAGSFAGCFKAQTEASFGPFQSQNLSWSHPAVPLSGLVRSQGVDKPTTFELVAFGEKGGGLSEIP